MKKVLTSLFTTILLGWGLAAQAQQNPCGLKAKFEVQADSCTVSFTDSSETGPGTTLTGWSWNFGDGGTSTLRNPLHTYLASGQYVVCLIVTATDSAGHPCKSQFCRPVTVRNCGQHPVPCRLLARFKPKDSCLTVSFSDNSAAGTGTTITSWSWTFGDGGTSTLQNPVHTYSASGMYNVCLNISGASATGIQCTDRTCMQVNVKSCVKPCRIQARFKVKDSCLTASFAGIIGTASGTTITRVSWNFGDGDTSSLLNPVHTYTAGGTYTVCLTVAGTNGAGGQCKDMFCLPVHVRNCQPCLVFPRFLFKDSCLTVKFTDSTSAGAGTVITNWFWSFGDGGTSTLQNPVHTYTASGNFLVCLTVTGNNKGMHCENKVCMPVSVQACAPPPCTVHAKFGVKDSCLKVSFTDSASAGAGTVIAGQAWDFGDGTSSTIQNPTHTYSASGTYNVCLVVNGINAAGLQCTSIACTAITVDSCPVIRPNTRIAAKKAAHVSALEIYPNPAQGLVNVGFATSSAGAVNITVYDMSGKKLTVLHDGYLDAGEHKLQWRSRVPGGLYVIILKTDTETQKKEIVVQ